MNKLGKIISLLALLQLTGCVSWKNSANERVLIEGRKSTVEFVEPQKNWRKLSYRYNGSDAYRYVLTSPSVDTINIVKSRYRDIAKEDESFDPSGNLSALAKRFVENEKESLSAVIIPFQYELVRQNETTTQDGSPALYIERLTTNGNGLIYRVSSLLIPMDDYFYEVTYKAVEQHYYQNALPVFERLLSSIVVKK